MLKSAIKSLLAHKTRLALTALSIVLGVAFIAGTFIYTDTTKKAFDGIFDDALVGIDAVVTNDSEFAFGQGVYFDESVVVDVAEVDGVDAAVASLTGFGVQIIGPDGEAIGGMGPPQFGAFLPSDESINGGFAIREGRAPTGPTEVVIDAASAADGEFAVGDLVPIVSQTSPEREFELVGIAGFGAADNLGGATFALFDLDTVQDLLGLDGQVDGVVVQAVSGTDVDDLVERIQQVLPADAIAQSAQTAAEAQAAEFQDALSFFNNFLLVFAFVALFVGSFIIYNTFRIVIAARLREMALLRAVGSTRSQVIRTVLTEATLIGAASSIVGILGGIGLAFALRAALAGFGIDLPSTSLVLAPRTVVVGLIVGVVVTVASAVFPAIRASRIPPVAAMRIEAAAPRRKSLTVRAIVGVVVTLAGVALLLSGLLGDADNTTVALSLIGFGAAVMIIGAYVLGAVVADPVSRVIGAPFARVFGIAGKLAQRNAGRSPRRTAATGAAVMIGIALISLVTIMAASIRGTIDDVLTGDINAQLVAAPANTFSFNGFTTEFAEEVTALPEVAGVSRVQLGAAIVGGSEQLLGSLDDNAREFFDADSFEGTADLGPTGLIVPKRTAEDNNWTLGSPVELEFEQTGTQTFTVEGIAEGPAWDSITMSREAYAANYAVNADAQVYVMLAAGVTEEQGIAAIQPLADAVPTLEVKTLAQQGEEIADQVDQLLQLITALLAMTVLISLFGVMNTMLLAVYERTREIGLLRAVGLDRTQTRRMVRSEASIIAVFGALLGVVLGVFFAWSVAQALAAEGFTAFVVPVPTLVIWVIVTGVLGLIFSLWPAWRASRLNVLEAIAYE